MQRDNTDNLKETYPEAQRRSQDSCPVAELQGGPDTDGEGGQNQPDRRLSRLHLRLRTSSGILNFPHVVIGESQQKAEASIVLHRFWG